MRVRSTLLAMCALLGAACSGDDDVTPGSGTSGSGSGPSSSSTGVVPLGFNTISLTVTSPDGHQRGLCTYLADVPELRRQGLMGVTDLGGLDGMLFRYDAPHGGRFWMKDTVMPLSIAFFDQDGRFVSATDMEPCPPGTDCPYYPAQAEYTAAIEVPQGELAELGLVAGSTLSIGTAPCP